MLDWWRLAETKQQLKNERESGRGSGQTDGEKTAAVLVLLT